MKRSPSCTCALAVTLLLVTGGGFGGVLARPQATPPPFTPYQLNPFVFSTPQEAVQALESPDLLQRRSGVEYLGRWTGTVYGMSTTRKRFDIFDAHKGLTADLVRAVQEMPKEDSQQAGRLLVLLGPKAEPAIPAVCAALVEQGGDNVFDRYEVMNTLIRLCGGPSEVAPKLVALMQSSEPATRSAAAGAAGLCDDIGFNWIHPAPHDAIVLSPTQSPIENIKFRALILPALTSRLDDPVTAVRLAALKSLEVLTNGSADACLLSWQKAYDASWQKTFQSSWQNTLRPLGRAVASPDLAVRLAALRVLAYMPGDVSPLSSALRGRLDGGKEEQVYALAALCHAAGTERSLVADVFLQGMSAPSLAERRRAAADVRLMVMPLWNGGFFPDQEPLRWFNDDRLFATTPSSLPGLSPSQRDMEQKRREAAEGKVQPRLLAALLQACSDPDASVRADAASSLDLIGQWAAAASAHGFLFAPANKSDLTVKQALTQAAAALQPTDPVRAKHFQEMSGYLWERLPWDFKTQKAGNTP
jgi:HEAT repeat protein